MPAAIDSVTVYGAYWCPDCRRARQFLGEHQISYKTNAELAAKLGLRTTLARKHFPLIIVGGGPAGLTRVCWAIPRSRCALARK